MGLMMPDFGYLKYEIKGCWERLALRDWLSRSPKLIIGVSVFLVVGVIAFLVCLTLPEKVEQVDTSEKQWFYDLNHQRLFPVKSGQLPPIECLQVRLPMVSRRESGHMYLLTVTTQIPQILLSDFWKRSIPT